jgi:hypothetical protein
MYGAAGARTGTVFIFLKKYAKATFAWANSGVIEHFYEKWFKSEVANVKSIVQSIILQRGGV